MDFRAIIGFLLLTTATACGTRTPLRTDQEPSCTIIIDPGAVVPSIVAEGERIYYVATEGRVMSADAQTGATTLLATVPIQFLNMPIGLALDADSLYFTFAPEDDIMTPALWRIPKTGGVPEKIASGDVDYVFVDTTGVYWTGRMFPAAKRQVFRRRPDGTTLLLGVIEETYEDRLRGMMRGSAGLLVPLEGALLAFDIDGGGVTSFLDLSFVSFPFKRDGALFFNLENLQSHGVYRASLDGTMVQQIYGGSYERVLTDGVSWVFTSPFGMVREVFGASYPDGEISFIHDSPTSTSPRGVVLTPTRLVLGVAWWEFREGGIQSICRDELGI